MKARIRSIVLALALPLLLQMTSGCALDVSGICGDECLRDQAESNQNSYVCSCSCNETLRTREIRVSDSADDAEETFSDGAMTLDSPDLEIPFGPNLVTRIVGVRFRNLQIPPGADILSAHIQFTAAATEPQVVSFRIDGQAADNPGSFTSAAHNLSSRQLTASSVSWSPAAWTAEASGLNQLTPNLEPMLQEIVDRPGWAAGNAAVFVISAVVPTAARAAYSFDGKPLSAPQLVIQYNDSSAVAVGPQDLQICVPTALNPNLGGIAATDADLGGDCSNRVQDTLSGLAGACGYPSQCVCNVVPASRKFSDKCDTTCDENPLAADCSNFDPVGGVVEATNAPGDAPVCIAHSPLAFGVYGRRTSCSVSGTAHVEIDGEAADPSASGIVQFRGDPCPGGTCAVDMEYRLDIGTVTFENAFGSESFEDLAGLGESGAGAAAMISPAGDGTFGVGECDVSARGKRESEQQAIATTNQDIVNFNVKFGATATSPTCLVDGALVGSADPETKRCESAGPDADKVCTDDGQCADDDACSDGVCNCLSVGNSELLLGLHVTGAVINQPPTADAGADQTVECPARPVLNATASSDLDSNLSVFSWRLGTRTGAEVGFEPISAVGQGLGTETYVLRVIDALGQADEDATDATVVDTTPPVLSCAVATSVLGQTNHNMANVGLTGRARDACEGELPVLVSVFADEDDEMQTGDGNFSPDAKNIALSSLRLRQERRGNADGRVYLIVVEATDSSGNRGINCCSVAVPHSGSQAALQSAQMQAGAARTFCLANAGSPPAGYFTIGDGAVIGPKQ